MNFRLLVSKCSCASRFGSDFRFQPSIPSPIQAVECGITNRIWVNGSAAAVTRAAFLPAIDSSTKCTSLYLFSDLFAGSIWVSTENPINSGRFTSNRTSFNCALDSPLPCSFTPGDSLPVLNIVYGFGQDNKKDMHILSSTGAGATMRERRKMPRMLDPQWAVLLTVLPRRLC